MVFGSAPPGAKPLGSYRVFKEIPLFGARRFGRLPFGGKSTGIGVTLPTIFSVVGHDAVADLAVGPIVTLYELITPAGATYRVADFADPDASSTLGQVTFDGNEYLSIRIDRPKVEETIDGRLPNVNIALHDPTHALLGWILSNDLLKDAKLNLHIIHYDDLDTPSEAITRVFRVRKVAGVEGPARVEIQFGAPNLTDLRFPILEYARLGCSNNYGRRFAHDLKNYCNVPSDEFETDTQQIFQNDSDAEVEGEYGWFVRNADRMNQTTELGDIVTANAQDGGGGLDLSLKFEKFGRSDNYVQDNTSTNGAFVYKKIVDAPAALSDPSSAEIDVYSKLQMVSVGADKRGIAIMIQSIDDPDNWIFFGLENYQLGSPYWRHQCRVTTNGVSVDTTYAGTDAVHRIARDGDDWTVYTAAEALDSPTPQQTPVWTEHGTHTLSMSGDIRVGIVVHSDDSNGFAVTVRAHAYHFRYLAGGYTSCDRTIPACTLRANRIHRNALEGLPDVVVF